MAPSLLSLSCSCSSSLPRIYASSSSSTTAAIETLDERFGRKGLKFTESGEVELTVRNGSSLKLQISNGHVTSYKPKVYWKDDGYEEVLHTIPPPSSTSSSSGGVGLVINEVVSQPPNPQPGTRPSSSTPPLTANNAANNIFEWTVKDVDSDSIDALQLELSCTRGTLDISYVISLYPLSMATAVIVKNNGRKAVSLTSAILSHFKFNKRSGAGVQGLRGCSYCTHPPLSSPFEILSPSAALKTEDPAGFFSFGWEPENKPGVWAIQDVPITVLKHKISRLYAAPPEERSKVFHRSMPSKYETIDQGRELFFRVIRMGFEEIYLSSPGSQSDKYGKDYFICTGPASMLVPVTVNPGEEWRGAQVIEHDNL